MPKVVLHDHLDGGLRVETILALAANYGGLPETEAGALARWFDQGTSGSLERYLEAFVHTVAVMQTPEALERVAYEAGEDLAGDGVVYAELRFAPTLLTEGPMTRHDAIEAALAGFARAEREHDIVIRLIVDAMRNFDDSLASAQAAVDFADRGVVGFDLAGPEAGFPPDDHLVACRYVREANLSLTIHAGEADGPHSMWSAMQRCGAQRLGHGIAIVEDCTIEDGAIVGFGPVASVVRDHQIHLEVAPTSNLHTHNWLPDEHPIGLMHRAGFNVGVNTDNRLMSRVDMSAEFDLLRTHHGFERPDLHAVTRRAMLAAFCDWDTKLRLVGRIDAAYEI